MSDLVVLAWFAPRRRNLSYCGTGACTESYQGTQKVCDVARHTCSCAAHAGLFRAVIGGKYHHRSVFSRAF